MEDLEQSNILAPTLLTPEGFKALQVELEHLTMVKRPEIATRLRESMDHGEFSEDNSELDEVKFEQAMIENRITDLKGILSTAQQLEPDMIPTDKVGVGSWVKVSDADHNAEFEVRIVSAYEANPDDDMISDESPMGLALIGKKADEVAVFEAPAGVLRYKVLSIRR
ncbi:MAG: transcription elongation factor GreA [Armatimonadetes bacterium]|nr:transcription elongation factor GreA [Armatimonadota bacterium]